MAVLYVYESEQAPIEMYDRVNSQITEVPEGVVCHVACERPGGGLFVIEVWQSEEQQERWNTQIQEKIQAAGGAARPEPRKYTVHNMRFGDTRTASAT